MNFNLRMIYDEIECEKARHKMEMDKLEYLKLKEDIEHRKNMNELISKKYNLIDELTKCNRGCSYKPEKISL